MREKQISKAVIKRLPRYRRYLKELQKKGIEKISSKDLSKLIGYTASQIRQDLNNFGGFGQQGYGYNVPALRAQIASILGMDRGFTAVLVGVGNNYVLLQDISNGNVAIVDLYTIKYVYMYCGEPIFPNVPFGSSDR